jgi:hypothetical protein
MLQILSVEGFDTKGQVSHFQHLGCYISYEAVCDINNEMYFKHWKRWSLNYIM